MIFGIKIPQKRYWRGKGGISRTLLFLSRSVGEKKMANLNVIIVVRTTHLEGKRGGVHQQGFPYQVRRTIP